MKEVSIIGVYLDKQVFRLHGATAEGEVVFRKKRSRKQFVAFMQAHPGCCVAMATGDGQVRLAHARRAKEQHRRAVGNEAPGGKVTDLAAVSRGRPEQRASY